MAISVKPRKTRQPSEESNLPAPTSEPEIKETQKPAILPNTVKVKVVIGTLVWNHHQYEKGDVFECTRQELAKFDHKDIQIVS